MNIVEVGNAVGREAASVEDEERTSEQAEGELEILSNLKEDISTMKGCTKGWM